MAAPAWRSSTTATKSATTNWSANAPAGLANGDFLLAALIHSTGDAFASTGIPAGWNLLEVGNVGAKRLTLFWKIAASEGASWTWTFASNTTGGIQVHAFSGVDINHPIGDRTGNALTSSTLVTTAGTTLVRDELVVAIFASNTSLAGSISTASGATEHSDVAYGTNRLLGVQSITVASPGSTGTLSVTVNGFSGNDYAYMLCLRPTPVVGPTIVRTHGNTVNGSANSNTVTYSTTPAAGNLLIAICSYEDSISQMATPSGWTSQARSGGIGHLDVFWKISNGTDTSQLFQFARTTPSSCCAVYEINGSSGIISNSAYNELSTTVFGQANAVASVVANECVLSIQHARAGATADLRSWPIEGKFEPIPDATIHLSFATDSKSITATVSYRTGTQPTQYQYYLATADGATISRAGAYQIRLGYKPKNAGLFFGSNF